MSTVTNEDRAEWALQALEAFNAVDDDSGLVKTAFAGITAFQRLTGSDDCDVVGDIIAHLMHLNDLHPGIYGQASASFVLALKFICANFPDDFGDFSCHVDRANYHYEAEIEEEAEIQAAIDAEDDLYLMAIG